SISSSTSILSPSVKDFDSNASKLADGFGEFIEIFQDLLQLRLLVLRDDAIGCDVHERVLDLRQLVHAKAFQQLNSNALNTEHLVRDGLPAPNRALMQAIPVQQV